jgi:YHS domain-containing protein/thiol-disulfide isomerase/thioredoxin
MPRTGLCTLGLFLAAAMASAALAQEGIRWQHDIEAAKVAAKQTNRLVLVHVWGDSCGPCRALEHNVFNQPGVAGAIEQQFVPVKINANEYPATAQGFGITRIPTDVIITPEGQLIGKMISPATPSAYVAELSQVAGQYRAQSGKAYQVATASAPSPKVLNPAYADLSIGAPTLNQGPPNPSPMSANQVMPPADSNTRYQQLQTGSVPLNSSQPPATNTTSNPYGGLPASPPAAPQPTTMANPDVDNRYAMPAPAGSQQISPPAQALNPYMPTSAPPTPTAPPAAAPTMSQYFAPPVTGYESQPQPSAVGTIPPNLTAPASGMGGAAAPGATQPSPAQPTAASAAPAAQLPAGSPPLGFDGFCPVSMRTAWKWVPGDAKFGAIHRGRTYLFAGPQEQQQFLANPDYYAPALAGVDPVMAIDHKQSVPGLREHSLDYDNQFYLFSSEATLQQFTANPKRYVVGAHQAMGIHTGPVR